MVTVCDYKSRNSLKTESFKEIKQCSEKKHLKYNFHMIFPLNDIILYCCGSLFLYIVLYIPFHVDSVFLCNSGTFMQLLTCESCRKQAWLPFDFVSRSLCVLGLKTGFIRDDIDNQAHGLFKYISRTLETQVNINNSKQKVHFAAVFVPPKNLGGMLLNCFNTTFIRLRKLDIGTTVIKTTSAGG